MTLENIEITTYPHHNAETSSSAGGLPLAAFFFFFFLGLRFFAAGDASSSCTLGVYHVHRLLLPEARDRLCLVNEG